MQEAMFLFGKRREAGVMATYTLPTHSRRLFIRDRSSKQSFLIDTGSDVSIICASKNQRQLVPIQSFLAANGTKIDVYGRKLLSIDLGLRRKFTYPFFICNVSTAILGADFLHEFNLKPDLRKRCLVDVNTHISSNAIVNNSDICSVKTVVYNNEFDCILKEFPNITKPPSPNQAVKHNVVHHIETTGPPIVCKPRRLAPDRLCIAKAEFQHMIDLGHMRPSKSNYASPLHMVPKKDSSDWRPVGDYRSLNAQTIKDRYGVPNILDFTAELHGTKIYSHVDLIKAYHQIPINPADVHKSAIITPFGLFESLRMQFGLCNASSTFQRFVDEVTRNLKGVYAFVDDILIASKSKEDHVLHLRALFERLEYYGLSINPSKCTLGVKSLNFLGFKVSEDGLAPLPDRVKAIQNFPQPSTITQLRRFLGLYNFYRRFIPKAASILVPLNKFLEGRKNNKKCSRASQKEEQKLIWTKEADEAFITAKEALATATLLRHPIPGARLSLWTDASDTAIGSSLMQSSGENWEPIAFLSMKLNKAQKNWSTYDRELLAIHSSIKNFRHMLEGREFTIFTDQKPLIYAFKQKPDKCSPRQLRQLDYISQFSTDIRHVKGNDNSVADALSRIEIDSITSPPTLDFKKLAEEQQQDEDLRTLLQSDTSLKLENHYFPLEDITLCCDKSTDTPRPFVPKAFRQTVFDSIHFFSHPGVAASFDLISKRFVWDNMRKDVQAMVRSCNKCQRAKVFRHTKAPLGTFAQPDARFSHIHLDFIGPFPPSDGKQYCMTIVDRFTRWPEVIPTADMTAETTARALMEGWISRFGAPSTITTDQGRNFESNLFRELTNMIGSHRIHSTAYHPKSNGMVERLHRQLKSAIIAHENTKWTEILPIVLLGLRTAVKSDLDATSSQLVYGTTLRLPSDLLSTDAYKEPISQTYVTKLISNMRKLNPVATTSHGDSKVYVNPSLQTCTHIFLRIDRVRPPLSSPYSGPHQVLSRNSKTFVIDLNGKHSTVSIDRVKPAFKFNEAEDTPVPLKRMVDTPTQQSTVPATPTLKPSTVPDTPTPKPSTVPETTTSKPSTTRSGRRVRFPRQLTEIYYI